MLLSWDGLYFRATLFWAWMYSHEAIINSHRQRWAVLPPWDGLYFSANFFWAPRCSLLAIDDSLGYRTLPPQ